MPIRPVSVIVEPHVQQLHLVLGRQLLQVRPHRLFLLWRRQVPAELWLRVMHYMRIGKVSKLKQRVLDILYFMPSWK